MVSRLDADIGRLMDKLKETGQDSSTLVIFSSDNGPHREGGHNPDFFDDNGPLRGIKRDLYEGGIRVPTIARWTGRIQPGQTSDHIWAFWDFLPTAAEAAGVEAPKDIDGLSILPVLTGGKARQHEYLYWEFHERGFSQAARMGDWKAVHRSPSQRLELYNLAEDIGETTDLAARNPVMAKELEEILSTARTESEFWPTK
ncbi:MAG TPA: sulfatase-like hydrolase/transferase [Methylococcaceae bacterium]|nr:sulfatase-like hydrolase/transferase [Methylococcaceae bacterium]